MDTKPISNAKQGIRRSWLWRGGGALLGVGILFLAVMSWFGEGEETGKTVPSRASQTEVQGNDDAARFFPGFWRGDVRLPKPDYTHLETLTFFTDEDYPPFNYRDEEGGLTGLNVDLARAICDVLAVECVIRAQAWDRLVPALTTGQADALVASFAITSENLERMDFTHRYYETPARFVARKDRKNGPISPEALRGLSVAVQAGTAHEAFLKKFFPQARIMPFSTAKQARLALKTGKADYLFGDGVSLVFWLNGTQSEGCCEFRGGPYFDSRYFGDGVGIAVRRGNRRLREILNFALTQLRADGRYEELFLRYFPMSYY